MAKKNEIIDDIPPSTEKELMLFLQEELEPLRRTKKARIYDLETEYAETKKNVLWSVWLTLGMTFLVVGLVTFFVVRGLSASARNIEVNLQSFEDLNLKNLFDSHNRTLGLYEEAAARRTEFQAKLDAKLSEAQIIMDNDLALLKNAKLSKLRLDERRKKIRDEFDNAVRDAHRQFDAQIASADAEAKQYEQELKSYDSENVARAQEWERKMDSERQIYELERQKMVDNYEGQINALKNEVSETRRKGYEDRRTATMEITTRYEAELAQFDPVIKDSKLNNINDGVKGISPQKTLFPELSGVKVSIPVPAADESAENQDSEDGRDTDSEDGEIAEEKAVPEPEQSVVMFSPEFTAALKHVQQSYDSLSYLNGLASSIPQKNSMRTVVSSQQKLTYSITRELSDAALEEIKNFERQNITLRKEAEDARQEAVNKQNEFDGLIAILNSDLVDAKTAGYVLDTENPLGISVYMRPDFRGAVKNDGSYRVKVYKGKNAVAAGALWFKGSDFYISLDKDEDKEKITVGCTLREDIKK